MKNKNKRLDALRVILTNKVIHSQSEAMEELERAGFRVTQPTVSNDLRWLHVVKHRTSEGPRLMLPTPEDFKRVVPQETVNTYFRDNAVCGITFSWPLAIIRTRLGYAQSFAADIDAQQIPEVAGTIAGNDTLFIACKENIDRQKFIDALSNIIPALKSIII